MLHRIYLMRHGETVDDDPILSEVQKCPTDNPNADIALSRIGIQQAHQTASRLTLENLPIDVVYSSPHYQCLETLAPIVTDDKGATVLPVRVEYGFRDWEDIDDLYPLCSNQCHHKAPSELSTLQPLFPYIDEKYSSMFIMPDYGWRCEPPRLLLMRAHFTIDHLIQDLDRAQTPQTVLICCTASVLCAIARVLSSRDLPAYSDFDPQYATYLSVVGEKLKYTAMARFNQPDHHAGFGALTRFDRRTFSDWRWKLSINGDQSHLALPSGAFRFRPSQWQNRHAPHPVLELLSFARQLPWSLVWLLWPLTGAYQFAQDIQVAGKRQLQKNPYRLPAWVYTILWCGLLFSISTRILTLHFLGRLYYERGEGKTREEEERLMMAWLGTIPDICGGLVQFSLFMFPPLMA